MIRSARRTPAAPRTTTSAHHVLGTSTPSPDGRSSIYFRLATRVPAAWGVRVDARDVIRRNRRAVPVLACVDRARVPAAAWRRAGRPPRRRKRWGRAQGTGRLGKRIKRYFRCGLPVRTGLSVVCTLSRRGSIHGGTRILIVTCPPVGLQCAWFARARARHRSVTVSSVVCRARGARHPGHSVCNQGMRKGCKSRY
jgi:hypothetical protein